MSIVDLGYSMTYVIGLAGAHGTGKSTILRGVKAANFKVDETQLSRTAQAALGWDNLSRAQESEENMWALQDAILQAMYDRDQAICDSQTYTLVDRTPADVWGYTAMWARRIGNIDWNRATAYKAKCREYAQRFYNRFLIVPIRPEIEFVAEANRADRESREAHEEDVELFIIQGGLKYYLIKSVAADYRVAEASAWLTLAGAGGK